MKMMKGMFLVLAVLMSAYVSHAAEKKVLVYTKFGKGFVHKCVKACADTVVSLGKENGFGVDVSDDPAKFTDENLKQYAALVFDNTNNEIFDTEDQKAALQKYIKSGGGFVGIHSTSGGMRKWPWFSALVGGKFKMHAPLQPFTMKIVDKNHPSTSGLGDTWEWTDELYVHDGISKDVHVLVEADVTSLKTGKKDGGWEKEIGSKTVPITWCHKVQGGREWFTALGHEPKYYDDPVFRKHILGGIMWAMGSEVKTGNAGKVNLMTLDPGHFHAGLVQKDMYDQVDPVVHVYAPEGPDLQEHLNRIEGYNKRAANPTHWQEQVYAGNDFLEKMISGKPGNVVVLSGNNAKKTKYILACVDAGLNVLADKPMAITPDDYVLLKKAFERAREKGVLLYDIMTERYEITTILQKELSRVPEVFGEQEKGTPEDPAVTKESVHHYFKYVSGKPLKRPAWFFDVTQQGEGIVDVTTHLVDLVQWECFPGQILDCDKDIEIVSAKRWVTKITPEQFKKATGLDTYPDYLKKDTGGDNVLNVYGNGEFVYKLKGICVKISVKWNFEPPQGAQDTHYSIMRGSRSDLVIRQGQDQNYKPVLFVEKKSSVTDGEFEKALKEAIAKIGGSYPGVDLKKGTKGWEVVVPDNYKVGHEAHFAQVTEKYLNFLAEGKMPDWEVPNMIAKYFTIMKAYGKSR